MQDYYWFSWKIQRMYVVIVTAVKIIIVNDLLKHYFIFTYNDCFSSFWFLLYDIIADITRVLILFMNLVLRNFRVMAISTISNVTHILAAVNYSTRQEIS